MFGIGAGELIFLAVVFILLFGSRKIPELARSVGDTLRYIRGIFSDDSDDKKEDQRK